MNKLFANQPIDGNSIIAEIQARRNKPGSSGFIRNRATGETVSMSRDEKPLAAAVALTTDQPRRGRDTAYDEDLMDADEGYRQYAQSQEYETGMVPSHEEYELSKDEPQEQVSEEELEETRIDVLNTMGKMSNFMEQKGITLDDVFNQLPEEIDDDTLQKVMDARKMETFDDLVNVGMAIDYMADALNLDTKKFFGSGEVVECGDECQEQRNQMAEGRQRG